MAAKLRLMTLKCTFLVNHGTLRLLVDKVDSASKIIKE